MSFWQNIFFAFWFLLPAGLANMFASLSGNVPKLRELKFPMDFNLTFLGKRIFGDHKTIRGLTFGIIIAILTVLLQKILYARWDFLHFMPIDFSRLNPFALGFLLGTGALIGDAIKSFFKRQRNIDPGHSWFFFDQIDYIFGAILFSFWYQRLTVQQYLFIVVIYFLLHIAANIIGYWLGLRKRAI